MKIYFEARKAKVYDYKTGWPGHFDLVWIWYPEEEEGHLSCEMYEPGADNEDVLVKSFDRRTVTFNPSDRDAMEKAFDEYLVSYGINTDNFSCIEFVVWFLSAEKKSYFVIFWGDKNQRKVKYCVKYTQIIPPTEGTYASTFEYASHIEYVDFPDITGGADISIKNRDGLFELMKKLVSGTLDSQQ